MQELTEIDSLADHTCASPALARWNVLEPISGRWSWLTVFECCRRVAKEPGDAHPEDVEQRAA
jgi:hypothetical protein